MNCTHDRVSLCVCVVGFISLYVCVNSGRPAFDDARSRAPLLAAAMRRTT